MLRWARSLLSSSATTFFICNAFVAILPIAIATSVRSCLSSQQLLPYKKFPLSSLTSSLLRSISRSWSPLINVLLYLVFNSRICNQTSLSSFCACLTSFNLLFLDFEANSQNLQSCYFIYFGSFHVSIPKAMLSART